MKIRGFTLLEVLIVVIIVGILASIALPQYLNTLEKARSAEAVSNIGTIRSSMDRYWFDRVAMGNYTAANLDILDIDNPNNNTRRLYDYSISDTGTIDTMSYTIYANRTGKTDYWVRWVQTNNTSGRLLKSTKLGGPES